MKYKNKKIVYEVGDWVTKIKEGDMCGLGVGETSRILLIGKSDITLDITNAPFCSPKCIRPATQEEIDKVDKIMVGDYQVIFPPEGCTQIITIGCVSVSKEVYLKIGKKAGWS